MLHLAICENEPLHAEILSTTLAQILTQDYDLETFSTAADFSARLVERQCFFDIVFMDIDLDAADISGISLSKELNTINPRTQIIYISQYLEFAPDVYSTRHTFFIYKSRLAELLPAALDAALQNLQAKASTENCLCLKQHAKVHRIPWHEIIYMERMLHTTHIYTTETTYSTLEKISDLLKQLPYYFVVCHRSYAVNLSAIQTFSRTNILLNTQKSLPIGRSHYENVKKTFARMLQEREVATVH